MLSLFDEPSTFNLADFRSRVASLKERSVWIGTSSWKYTGWLDQIYSRRRYVTRGRFSKKQFETQCVSEYAETFATVCGDFAFYQFPSEEFWAGLFGRVPPQFLFSLKIPEQVTRAEFPKLSRYGPQSGQRNDSFLDAELLKSGFLKPLERYRSNLGALILEFGALPVAYTARPTLFVEALDSFLSALPSGFRFAVEVRNQELLVPTYFECLRAHHVSHVLNCWTRMPEPFIQMSLPGSMSADFIVCRALLRPGRSYEQAVRQFEPYTEIKEPYEPARRAIRELMHLRSHQQVFIYVNNRLEGNAPLTIEAIMKDDTNGLTRECT